MRSDLPCSVMQASRAAWIAFSGALVLCTVLGVVGCKNAHFVTRVNDGGATSDGARKDVAQPNTCSPDTPSKSKGKAESCSCDRECQTGFCADGVCCTSACGETCKACNLRSSLGDCAFVPSGVSPNDSSVCPASTAATCGRDGTCDGKGGCRQYVKGTECKSGTCDGDSVTGVRTCDGNGSCSVVTSVSCPPYTCDSSTNHCAHTCATNGDCAADQLCVANRCGKSASGAVCSTGDDCASGFCVDGVCCNVACSGPCVSCNQTGSVGRCTFIPVGWSDPACKGSDRSTCGNTGLCDGFGSCTLYAADTPCGSSSCSGLVENAPQTCDGKGTCRDSQQQVDCSPYLCLMGACGLDCTGTGCADGYQCVQDTKNGTTTGLCGKRKNGQPCQDSSECESSQCVDGVCCESSCTGPCRSCALPGSPGQCLNVAIGAPDPRKTCVDDGVAACSTNGVCDGQGACQTYQPGTPCGPESCAGWTYTYPFTCDTSGQCKPSGSRDCSPYVCNGSTCFDICTSDAQCVPGKQCTRSSCGLKPSGANCSLAAECQSGFCAQGVCCDTACTEGCMACNLPLKVGTCSAVADKAPDPQGKCVANTTNACGTTGNCVGGACAYLDKGVNCKAAVCASASSVTPASTCDGKGACSTPANQTCGNFICASGACKSTCASNTDCNSPATCEGNSCGLKENGVSCTAASQCKYGFCAGGVCCNSACTESCKTCRGTASNPKLAGTCSNVDNGSIDPKGSCKTSDVSTCSGDGTCNGSGGCRLWPSGTVCQAESCSNNIYTAAAVCDGSGVCVKGSSSPCDSGYSCAGQTCQPSGSGGIGGGTGGSGGATGGTGGGSGGSGGATGGTGGGSGGTGGATGGTGGGSGGATGGSGGGSGGATGGSGGGSGGDGGSGGGGAGGVDGGAGGSTSGPQSSGGRAAVPSFLFWL